MEEVRADSFAISDIADKIDKNGYLRIKGTLTKCGVFSYPQPDGSVRKELRHPDEVFRADSMNTLKTVPIVSLKDHIDTLNGLVAPDDAGRFNKLGVTGENIVRTPDDCLDSSITIHDKATIKSLLDKPRQELSAAYRLRLDKTPGIYKGDRYDVIQRDIIYGHMTLLDKGRAGSRCHTRADTAGSSKKKEKNMAKKREIPALKIGEYRADTLTIEETEDTIALLARTTSLAVALQKQQTRADTAEDSLSTVKGENEEFKKKLETAIPEEQYRADMKESASLHKLAAAFKIKKFEEMMPKELKIALCKANNPGFDETRADTADGYLAGAFSYVEAEWKQKISQNKTLESLRFNNKEPVSDTEYEAPITGA